MLSLQSAAAARRQALVLAVVVLGACLPAIARAAEPGPLLGWGENGSAQLGDGNTVSPRSAPIELFDGREVTEISSGANHTVALADDGTVWTWGAGTFGKLGDGATVASGTPIKVPSLSNIVGVAAGDDHSLAVRADGAVFGWGDSTRGQAGNLSVNPVLTPVAVLQSAVDVAAAGDTSMALGRDGAVWVWGENSTGQLGVNPALTGNAFKNTPQKLPQFGIGTVNGPARAIAQGTGASYAVLQSGSVWAWGANGAGQVNGGGSGTDFTPGAVPGPAGFADIVDVAAGSGFAIARKATGSVWTWGEDDDGRLGTGAAAAQPPTEITGLSGVTEIAAGRATGFAVVDPGVLWSWGDDAAGTVGDGGTLADVATPAAITSLGKGVAGVGAGADGQQAFAIAQPYAVVSPNAIQYGLTSAVGDSTPFRTVRVKNEGADDLHVSAVDLWGGDADSFDIVSDTCTGVSLPPDSGTSCLVGVRFAPATDGPATTFVRVVSDGSQSAHLVRLDAFGTGFAPLTSRPGPIWAWGSNTEGELGDLSQVQRDAPVPGPGEAVALAAGRNVSFALRQDGTVWGWGDNDYASLLGDFGRVRSLSPVRINGINAVTAIAAGRAHVLALRTDGTVWGWGDGNDGKLGNEPVLTENQIPVPAQGVVADVVAISAGVDHSVAVRRDGTVMAWGSNSHGQAGGPIGMATGPQFVSGPFASSFGNIVDVAAGSEHNVALKGDGTVWTWGSDASGQLGNGVTTGPQEVAEQVPGITNAVAVAAGGRHSAVLLADGTMQTWGEGTSGQLGNGPGVDSDSPVSPVITNVVDIAATQHNTLARTADGRVRAWGSGTTGVIGDFTTPADAVLPTQVAVVGHGGGPFGGGPAALHALMIGRPHIGLLSSSKLSFDPPAPPVLGAGDVSNAQSVIIGNNGAAPLRLAKPQIVAAGNAPDGDEFRITGDGCADRTLAPGQVCHIGVRYTPVVTETRTSLPVAYLRVTGDAENEVMVELDPPPADPPATSGGGSPMSAEGGSSSAPSLAAAVEKAAAVERVRATCAKARAGRRTVRLSCRVTGSAKGRTLSVWLKRGRTVHASGRAKVKGGRADLRLKVRRALRRGTYTATVAVSGGGQARSVQTLRVAVR